MVALQVWACVWIQIRKCQLAWWGLLPGCKKFNTAWKSISKRNRLKSDIMVEEFIVVGSLLLCLLLLLIKVLVTPGTILLSFQTGLCSMRFLFFSQQLSWHEIRGVTNHINYTSDPSLMWLATPALTYYFETATMAKLFISKSIWNLSVDANTF